MSIEDMGEGDLWAGDEYSLWIGRAVDTCPTTKLLSILEDSSPQEKAIGLPQTNSYFSEPLGHSVSVKWKIQKSDPTGSTTTHALNLYCSLWWSLQEKISLSKGFLPKWASDTHSDLLWTTCSGSHRLKGQNVSNLHPFRVVSNLEEEEGHHTKHHQWNQISWQCEETEFIRAHLRKNTVCA